VDSDDLGFIAAVVLFVALIAGLVVGVTYWRNHEPCSWYGTSSLRNVPARCLSYFEQQH
jgi:hypothetical protein